MSRTLVPSTLRLAAVLAITAATLLMNACGGGSAPMGLLPPPPRIGHASPVTVSMGDAPADSVVGFEVTVNNITLTDSSGNSVVVLNTPRRIELAHNSATVEPLSALSVPQGTYTKATITVSSPEVEVVNASGQVIELVATLAGNPATVGFSPSIVIGDAATSLSFDFNLAASVTINGNTATVTPSFSASSQMVAAEAEQDDESGEIEDLTGTVSGVAAPSFTVMTGQNSQSITFTTDPNTRFEGIADLSGLQQNMVVQVDAVTQSDGTFLAKKVEVEEADAAGLEAEGIVTSIAGLPNSFQLVVQDQSSPSNSAPAVGKVITVNVSGSTRFRIQDSNNIDLGGLGFTPAFGVATLAPAQSVEADTDTAAANSIDADTMKLQLQAITGMVSGFTQIDASHASFTLTPAADSVFDSLSTKTSLMVFTTGKTELKGVGGISNGANLRVRGLLFFQGGAYTMVAARVTTP